MCPIEHRIKTFQLRLWPKYLPSVLPAVAWTICFSFLSEIQVKSQTLEKEAKECRLRTEEWYVEMWIPRGPEVRIRRPEFWF
jgi:hypothetical protein